MKNTGLTLDQFESMFRRWAERNGLPATALDHKALKSVLNYVQQQSPFAVEERRGRVLLHFSIFKSSDPTDHVAIMREPDGEVWGISRYISNRQKRKALENIYKGFPHSVSNDHKIPIINPREMYKEYFAPKSWEPTAFLIARMLHHRLIEARVIPVRRQPGKAADERFDHAGLHASLLQFSTMFEKRRRTLVLNSFLSSLDPEIYDLSQVLDRGNSQTYNWLVAKSQPQAIVWRRQVAENSPLLVLLAAGQGHRMGLTDEFSRDAGQRVTDAIDQGSSLPAAVAQVLFHDLRVPFWRPAVRMIMSMRAQDIPEPVRPHFYRDAEYLGRINPNWYPRTPDDWQDYHDCIQAFIEFRELSPSHDMMDLIKETGGKWAEIASLVREHGKISDLNDWEQAIRKKVIEPRLLVEDIAFSGYSGQLFSRKDLYAGLRFGDALRASMLWHKKLSDFNHAIASLTLNKETGREAISWLPIDETKTAPNGIVCEPLTTPEDLRLQHEAQDHCVDGYSSHCLYGQSHIIRLKRDVILTTVELRHDWNAATKKVTSVKIAQHQGYQRRAPTVEERSAIDWYVAGLKPNWDAIVLSRAEAEKNRAKNAAIIEHGFDPYDVQARLRAYEICREFFPPTWRRHMSYDSWFLHVVEIGRPIPSLAGLPQQHLRRA